MIVDKILTKTASSKAGQRFYKYLLEPKREAFLQTQLPCIESLVCLGSYMYATARDKKIPEERKPILQWQNVLNGVIGMAVSGGLNAWISKKGKEIIKHLHPENIEKFSRVCDGIKVGLPILVTALVMRFGISTLSVPMSDAAKKMCNLFKSKDDPSRVDLRG